MTAIEPFDAVDLIKIKRDGGELSAAQIGWLVDAYTRGYVADEQMSAMTMAVRSSHAARTRVDMSGMRRKSRQPVCQPAYGTSRPMSWGRSHPKVHEDRAIPRCWNSSSFLGVRRLPMRRPCMSGAATMTVSIPCA